MPDSATRATGTGSPVEALLWGTQVPTTSLTINFAGLGVVVDGVTSEGWTPHEIDQAMLALAAIEAVTTLSFARVADPSDADLVVGLDSDELTAVNVLGYFNPPGEPGAGTGSLNAARWDRTHNTSFQPGGSALAVFTHEILHGLGLAHPHDAGGKSSIMAGVDFAFGDYGAGELNQGIYTNMSYNAGWNAGDWGTFGALSGSWGYQFGPMALDIAALQAIYGGNPATGTGDDIYRLPDLNATGTVWQAIWDTGGNDTLVYDGIRDAVIDLRAATLAYEAGGAGYISAARAVAGGFTIAQGVVIENAITGTGNDRLMGNDANNVLFSGRGNDRIDAMGGHDRITAHRGDDTVNGGAGDDWISAGRGDDTVRGGPGDDEIYAGRGDDRLIGGPGDDVLWGRKGRDEIDGGEGNDVIVAGSGADSVRAGPGDDIVTLGFGADIFIFRVGDGTDKITDFHPGRDMLLLDPGLLGPVSLSDLIAGARMGPSGLTLDFTDGEVLILIGIDDADALSTAIEFDL